MPTYEALVWSTQIGWKFRKNQSECSRGLRPNHSKIICSVKFCRTGLEGCDCLNRICPNIGGYQLCRRETWSSGYGRRLTSKRLWIRFPALYTRWTFYHIYCYKNSNVSFKRLKINDKRGRLWPIIEKERKQVLYKFFYIGCSPIWTVSNANQTFSRTLLRLKLKTRRDESPIGKNSFHYNRMGWMSPRVKDIGENVCFCCQYCKLSMMIINNNASIKNKVSFYSGTTREWENSIPKLSYLSKNTLLKQVLKKS